MAHEYSDREEFSVVFRALEGREAGEITASIYVR
jgi:hypothetical protein